MRILVVEDEPELAELIAAGLRRAGFAADGFGTADEAKAAHRAVGYDLIVLDLGLPDGDGTGLLRELRRGGDSTPVLIVTARDALAERVAGLDAGADDYVTKPCHVEELAARVRALLRRPGRALGVRLEAGNVVLDTVARRVEVGGAELRLRRRELALLETLMRGSGRVVGKEAIEAGLYGFDDDIGSNAVEVHVHRLRRRLEAAGATVRIHTLRGIGYLLDEGTGAGATA